MEDEHQYDYDQGEDQGDTDISAAGSQANGRSGKDDHDLFRFALDAAEADQTEGPGYGNTGANVAVDQHQDSLYYKWQ